MSACGSLQHIFENPLPENHKLLEPLSWNQIKPLKSIDHTSSITEIFGELHFKESTPDPSPPPPPSLTPRVCSSSFTEIDDNQTPSSYSVPYVSSTTPTTNHAKSHKSSDSFSSLNSESLQLCTEGLGLESSDDVEELKNGMNEWWQIQNEEEGAKNHLPSLEDSHGECRTKSRVNGVEYPPPISCIGRSGKPWVSFRCYRNDGRFVLKEIRIPTQEFLHAHREDGRLKLHFVQPDEESPEEEEEEEDDVDSIDEGKVNDESVKDQINEEKRD
ncbi:uncharacterized protein LOC133316383 [Gastrolobium bilobum]|uniref:uncharacterized protein LOC133316383 n=1 Tax=Gastrolobium bilobum TaxID=150636 RepID=UPI002AB0F8B4|nr:uncharacterized protein LOC133316383 [Gastrolobium bilobum]